MSTWDDPSLSTGEYIKFENPGDEVVGQILDISIHTFEDGKKAAKLVIKTDDGEERILTAGQVQLGIKLKDARPEVGDRIKITFDGIEKRSMGKTLKLFTVAVAAASSAAKKAPAPAVTSDTEPPF